jgi:hypothetical protein
MYCGDAAEMIQPLLLIGMKTPISMQVLPGPLGAPRGGMPPRTPR